MPRSATADDSARERLNGVYQLAYRGHVRDAYRAVGAQFPALLAELALLGVVPADSADAVFRSWVSWERPELRPPWWAFPWWAGRGDTAAISSVGRWAETGLRAPPKPLPPFATEIMRYVQQSSRAYLALARGDSAAALRLFEALPDSACYGNCAMDGLVRIQLLVARRRYRDAAARLDPAPGDGGIGIAQSPERVLWELERGRVQEQLRNRDAALAAYGFVAAVWAHADPELRPYVEEARAGLKRLGGEPRF